MSAISDAVDQVADQFGDFRPAARQPRCVIRHSCGCEVRSNGPGRYYRSVTWPCPNCKLAAEPRRALSIATALHVRQAAHIIAGSPAINEAARAVDPGKSSGASPSGLAAAQPVEGRHFSDGDGV